MPVAPAQAALWKDTSEQVRGHMPALDGWRGVAILLVVLHNAAFIFESDGQLAGTLFRTVAAAGWVGVSLFFVLSGFLITGILLDTLESPTYFRGFYIRRTLRIFPLYYAALALAFWVFPALGWSPFAGVDGSVQLWYWLYGSNYLSASGQVVPELIHFWSLAVEEQFYLVWPALVWVAGARRLPLVVGSVVVASLALRVLLVTDGQLTPAYEYTLARADALALGALLASAVRNPRLFEPVRRALPWAVGGASLVFAGTFLLRRGFEPLDPVVLTVGQFSVALLFAGGLLASVAPSPSWNRRIQPALRWGWLRRFGKYSYAIYVIHVPLHMALQDRVGPFVNAGSDQVAMAWTAAYAVGILAGSTVLAWMSWHLLEERFLRLKDRLAPRR